MADEKMLKQAKTVFNELCVQMDELGWHYTKDEEGLKIECAAQGDDLPIDVRIQIDPDRQLVALFSQMPYAVPEKNRAVMTVALSKANCRICDGNFEMDLATGRILFRLTSSYCGSLIGKGLFKYLILCACYTVDEYNDKFLMVFKNNMSIEEILKYID